MKRKGMWLAVSVVLLGLSAWLMSRGDAEKPTSRPPKMEFPHQPKQMEQERNQKRRTLPPLPSLSEDAEGFRKRRDPVLVALPTDTRRSVMVFEFDALKESPLSEAWLDCLLARDDRERAGLDRFKERIGIDPLEDIDRVAVSSEKVIVLQGSFDHARFDPDRWERRNYGENGIIYRDSESGRVMATWGADMMIASGSPDSPEAVEEAIDRLESKDPEQKTILNDYDAYGDIYGVVSPEDLAAMLPAEQSALSERIRDLVNRIDIHVDASEDVAITAQVSGGRGQNMDDLAKSFGAALAVGRIKAKNDGDDKLAELLDFAKVKPTGAEFAVDVALPIELLKQLGPCRKERMDRPRQAVPKSEDVP